MKKRNVKFLLIAIILVGMTSLCHAYVAYYNLFVVSGEDSPARIYQLKILPNGQILDTYIQYTTGENNEFIEGSLAVSPHDQFLFAASDVIYRFQIQADGSLVSIGITTPSSFIAFTPNDQLVITGENIYSLTSTGNLVNGISSPGIDYPYIDPLGRGVLGISSSHTLSAYTINYNTRTMTQMTTFPVGNGDLYGINFTPDGKLGFLYGFNLTPNNTGDLWVLNIDSVFNVTTTSQIFNVASDNIGGIAVSNDNRYLWAPTGDYIELFAIDTLGKVTDTGKEYGISGTLPGVQKNTPDGSLAIVDYLDMNSGGRGFATAYIDGDGSLTWTGYTFAFDSAHPTGGTVVDYAIVPVYATGIPEEFWKDPPPEIILHDSQKILINP